jgi:hypothetical protein
MTRTRLRSLVVLIGLVASILPGVAPTVVAASAADSPGAIQPVTCSLGDVSALLEVSPLPSQVMRARGQDHPGLLDAYAQCQYRLFRDGETFTFCEDDYIFGSKVANYDYKASGLSREEAIAELDQNVDRAWLDGIERILEASSYKDLYSVTFGLTVYQVRGFIAKLSPGDHVSTWLGRYPGFPDDTATVTLHILPRASCA